jgi:hypothetical protein
MKQSDLFKYKNTMKLDTDLFSAWVFEVQQMQETDFSEMKEVIC